MKKPFLILLLSLLLTTTYAQNDSVKLVVGLEMGSNFHHIANRFGTYGFNSSFGLSLEYPKNQFSFGLAALRKDYGLRRGINPTGESNISISNGEVTTEYAYYPSHVKFDYLALSTRLIYRLPCNCIYLYSAYDVEFLNNFNKINFDLERPNSIADLPEGIIEQESLKKINQSFIIGFGVKAHFRERLRLNMRFTYGLTKRPSVKVMEAYKGDYRYLGINLGIQYGLGTQEK